MQPSHTVMIYELRIEAYISPFAAEYETYMSQFKSKAIKRGTCTANGSVLLRNCVQAVLPAAMKSNSFVFGS